MSDKKKTKLTGKQEKFCNEYLIDFNGTRAAISAGYSEKTARKIAHENLTKPDIQRRIQSIADAKMKKTGDPVERIILELQLIAFGDYKDLVIWDDDGIKKWIPSEELGEKSRIVQEISETTTQHGGSRKIKTYDKVRALEMLGRYHKIFTDKVEHSNPDGTLAPVVNIVIPANGREKK